MYLIDFMNSHSNWQELLAAEPYYLDIRADNIDGTQYYLLKYNQIMSDMSLKLVQEARGSIFRQNEEGFWTCVCYPFNKFFNYGEKYSAISAIDWSTATVQQKVDGSLIKIWWDYDGWIISTNGSIDAFKAECGDTTYGDLVEKVINRIPNFFKMLDRDYTYMFELTSPYNRIVIRYEGINLWYLGRRNILNWEEDREGLNIEGLLYPTLYPHHSLSECIAAAHNMGDDEEGYVVCDKNFNRIKIKGDEYLTLHKLRGNGPLTTLRIVEMWQEDKIDDFIAYFPEFNAIIEKTLNCIRDLTIAADLAYSAISNLNDRKSFAMNAITYPPIIRNYLFMRFDNKVSDVMTYVKTMRARTLASYIAAKNNSMQE